MNLAFFDFDGTLTRRDSFIEFAKFSVGRRSMITAFMKSLPVLIAWKIGMRTNSEAKQVLFSNLFKGMKYERFKSLGENFKTKIDKMLRPEVINILKNHRRNGDKIIIVSASISDWIRPWAEDNCIDRVIGTEIEVDDNGIITGRFLTPNCHGEQKVNRIKTEFPDFDKYEKWAYGDSSGDDPMLKFSDHPNKLGRII